MTKIILFLLIIIPASLTHSELLLQIEPDKEAVLTIEDESETYIAKTDLTNIIGNSGIMNVVIKIHNHKDRDRIKSKDVIIMNGLFDCKNTKLALERFVWMDGMSTIKESGTYENLTWNNLDKESKGYMIGVSLCPVQLEMLQKLSSKS